MIETIDCVGPYYKSNIDVYHNLMIDDVFEGEELQYNFIDEDDMFKNIDFNNLPNKVKCAIIIKAKQILRSYEQTD